MNDRSLIDPELRKIAYKVPYNAPVIRMAALFLPIMLRTIRIPKEIKASTVVIRGYQDRKLRVEVFEPANETNETDETNGTKSEILPAMLYLHGGAFSYQGAPYHKKLAMQYARDAHCKVVLPDYHLSPKYPYPAAYEDTVAVYRWMQENARELQIDSTRIAVAGDSAGAALAALLCNNCEKRDLISPCAQMLIYPVTDASMSTDSMRKYKDTPLWNAKNNRKMWEFYLNGTKWNRNGRDQMQPNGDTIRDLEIVSPMQQTLPENIPHTYIETAEFDCLHDEGALYAKKLVAAGVKVELNETRGTIHGYDSALNAGIVKENVAKRIAFLKTILKEE